MAKSEKYISLPRVARFYRAYGACIASAVALPVLAEVAPAESWDCLIAEASGQPRLALDCAGDSGFTDLPGIAQMAFLADSKAVVAPYSRVCEWDLLFAATEIALPMLLRRRGESVYHAATLAKGDAAVALLGDPGSGKSLLAACLLDMGFRLLDDDVLAIRLDGGAPMAQPGVQALKLRPNALAIIRDRIPLPVLHEALGEKTWLALPPHPADAAAPLKHLVFLSPAEDSGASGQSADCVAAPAMAAARMLSERWYGFLYPGMCDAETARNDSFRQSANLAKATRSYRLNCGIGFVGLRRAAERVDRLFRP